MKPLICKVEGCQRAVKARGWCGTHYERWYRDGDPQAHVPIRSERINSVLKQTGATYRQLDYWATQGWLSGGNPGSGQWRDIYTPEEKANIALLVRASRLSLPEIADLLRRLDHSEQQGAA